MYSCSLWGFPMFCFVLFSLKLPLYALWGSSKLCDIELLWMGEFLGAPSLYGPSGFKRAHFACPGGYPIETFSDTSRSAEPGCTLLAVLSWHEHLSGLLFYGSLQTAWKRWKGLLDLRKKVVRNEHEDSEALAELRFPSDVSEHVGFFCWPSEVCALLSHSLPASIPLSLALPLWEPTLCIHFGTYYFFVLENLESAWEPPFQYSKWDRFLSHVFLEFFLELHILRGIEILLPSLCKPSSVPLELCEAVCFSSVVAHVSSLGSVACRRSF